ncbi:Prolyl tripeptidyl peptidase precursor [Bacteroidales bacterium Barb7]|nr:Prolyl tripeptidyl peptidase precursor [Bacteroidales bacterium Barb7]
MIMIRKSSISALFLIATLLGVYAAGENTGEKKPVGIDFFTKVKGISNIEEKDGNIFFIVSQIKEEGGAVRDLYQLIDGKPVRLTSSGNVSDYFFEEGGNGIIFRNVRDEKDREKIKKGEQLTVFQKLSTGYQEAEEWLRLPFAAGQIEWIGKDRFFYTSSYSHHFELLLRESDGNRQEALKKKEENKGYRIFDELPFWSNGRGDVSGQRTHLYYYDKGKSTLLSDTFETVSSLKLSPDKKTLVYTSRKYYGKAPQSNHLVTLNAETLEKKEHLLFKEASYGGFHFLNDDELFLTINRSIEHDKSENAGFYRLHLRSGNISEIYDGAIYSSSGGSFTFDKDGARYLSTVVDRTHLLHLAYKDAKVTFLTKGDISVQNYLPYKDGFLLIATIGQQGEEIYFLDRKGGLSPLTSINTQLFAEHNVVEPVEITFTNREGRELNGYVLPPAGYEKGKKYPAILDIHGGPKSVYKASFFHEMQYWANQGYAVFFTNPTGSDGRGAEFADIRGKIGTIDYDDLMDFTDAVLKQTDFIDKERLGVTGGSYGGVMTNWIIGHTDRFKAAASQRSISSWQTFSNTSDIGHSFTYTYFGTDVWKNSELLWDRSPLKYADKVKTPTLFLHSDEDYRCWLEGGLQMYYALQYFEVPTRMIIFKGENHELSRSGKPQNRIKRLDEITKWFDKYLKAE